MSEAELVQVGDFKPSGSESTAANPVKTDMLASAELSHPPMMEEHCAEPKDATSHGSHTDIPSLPGLQSAENVLDEGASDCEPLDPVRYPSPLQDVTADDFSKSQKQCTNHATQLHPNPAHEAAELVSESAGQGAELTPNSGGETAQFLPEVAEETTKLLPKVAEEATKLLPKVAEEAAKLLPEVAEEPTQLLPKVAEETAKLVPEVAGETTKFPQEETAQIPPKLSEETVQVLQEDETSEPPQQSSAETADSLPEPMEQLSAASSLSPEQQHLPAPTQPDSEEGRVSAAAADDSGCELESPAIGDVEQLARSVVSDTLQRAKEDAALMRHLENSGQPPDTDDGGWLDIVGNGQLKKKVITAGRGGKDERPRRSQVVTVRLSARLSASGEEVPCRPDTVTFGLGDGEVITGLDMAVGLMQPGETAELLVDPRFGYGECGLEEGGIPGNATMLYTVTLEGVLPEPKYEEMSTEQRLRIGSEKRDRGNWWFKRDDFNHALQCYRRALDFFDNESEDFTGLPDDVHVLFEERLKVHNNMAAAQMKLGAMDVALRSLQIVLNCQPNNVKALYRKGKVLASQDKLTEAADALRLALQHSPDSRTIQLELNKVTERQRKAAEQQKNLYRRMLGLPAEDKPTGPANQDKKYRLPITLLVCGVVCGLAAVVVSRLNVL